MNTKSIFDRANLQFDFSLWESSNDTVDDGWITTAPGQELYHPSHGLNNHAEFVSEHGLQYDGVLLQPSHYTPWEVQHHWLQWLTRSWPGLAGGQGSHPHHQDHQKQEDDGPDKTNSFFKAISLIGDTVLWLDEDAVLTLETYNFIFESELAVPVMSDSESTIV